jgi:outer membrane immunogenic protein
VLAVFLPASALALELPPQPGQPDPSGWFVRTYFLGSISSAPGSFAVLPPGATGGDQTSYQPQEFFGAGAGIGYQFSAWGVPFRAVFDSSLNFRHDTDVAALPAHTPNYKGNLQTIDLRLSLLADVLDLGWGRFYVGGGIGGTRVRTEVEFEGTPTSVVNTEWKPSPSFEAGIAFTGFSRRVIPYIGYRFRWIGETESGTFSDGSKVRYKNFNVHDLMFGLTVPLQEYSATDAAFASLMPSAGPGENMWTGFHVGAYGGWGVADDLDVTGLATSAGVPYNATNTYSLGSDGFLAGGEIGVDWQWRWLVLGLAGEAGVMDFNGKATDPASPGGDTTTKFSSDWYGGMSVRGGLAYDRFLAYGRAGAFYVNAEAKTTDNCTTAPCGAATASASEDDILFGWYLGGGIEYAIGSHWSIGGEYRFIHPNDKLQPAGTSSSLGSVSQEVKINPIHAGRVSVNFRW